MKRKRSDVPPAAAAFAVVGIGASAGGLEAFTQLLGHLPADSGMAFVLVQHLDPSHPSLLPAALARATAMPVLQAEDGMAVEPDHVYVIPPGADLSIRGGRLTLVARSGARVLHLPVDGFFRALAAEHGARAIGVVLSGTASDGTQGLLAIKAEGGVTFAQDPRSARFPGMPQSALQAGAVDRCLPLEELARELVLLGRHPYVAGAGEAHPEGAATIEEILRVVRGAMGVDFSEYKRPTILRRLARRMAVRRVAGLDAYLALLHADPDEVRGLYEDVLIHVTTFFRDPEVFETLRTEVFPEILRHKAPGSPIRLWIAGCSTGEEVYSLAIALLEALDTARASDPIQIFASDVSERAIQVARAGVYLDGAMREVSDERRRRFFTKTDRGYRIVKEVRDLCVFVRHDLARDPPFSRLDLVSCRNVLIYFDHALQKRVLPTFHHCLAEPGFLLLGRAEGISTFEHLFRPVDKHGKIFARTTAPSELRFAPRAEARPVARGAGRGPSAPAPPAVSAARHLDHLLLSRYCPPAVLVDEKLEVLEIRGETGPFLRPAPGTPRHDLLRMARGGLLAALRATTAQARTDLAPARARGVVVEDEAGTRTCDVVVVPLLGPDAPAEHGPLFVVLFEEEPPPPSRRRRAPESKRIEALEHELLSTRGYLQALFDDQSRTNEELGSVNDDLVSGNEELQSMNEELETAKEELQSSNEELTTLNDELQSRNHEISEINSDLVNLVSTVDIPILILDGARRIRRFTPRARDILTVLPTDVGRPLGDINPNIRVPDLDQQVADVITSLEMRESEVQDRAGHWYRLQIRPYRTPDDKIDGAILSLVDIDALKHLGSEAQQARMEAEQASRAKDDFLATLSHELRSPLASLMLNAQLLRDGGLDAAVMKRSIEAIDRSARTQMKLIDDLLDVSRIVAGKLRLELQAVDVTAVVRAALEAMAYLAARKSIRVEALVPPSSAKVTGDPARLQQVVANLLSNAIKFTPEGGRITVTVAAAAGKIQLTVADTGIGIDAAFLPRVFDRFSQADSSNTRAHGGLGLGLAIVRHLVEAHGGSVTAESPGPGLGATFSVTLPLRAERAAGEAAAAAQLPAAGPGNGRPRLARRRVLVVDDDAATREAIAEKLGHAGATVKVAGSAGEALAAVPDFRPDVIVSDVAMPGEDGHTLIRGIRALGHGGGGDVPALALTALAGAEDRRRALEAGFDVHLAKPVDLDRLVEVVFTLGEAEAARPGG